MASAKLSRRVEKAVAYPPLCEMSADQRREFHESLLDADSFEDLPGKWQAAILRAEQNRPNLRVVPSDQLAQSAAVGYLLLADSHTFTCRTWDDLTARLVWARGQGYATAKARRANGWVDRPLLPSEQAQLVNDATRLVLGQPGMLRGSLP